MNLAYSVWEIVLGVLILAIVLAVAILVFWLCNFLEK